MCGGFVEVLAALKQKGVKMCKKWPHKSDSPALLWVLFDFGASLDTLESIKKTSRFVELAGRLVGGGPWWAED